MNPLGFVQSWLEDMRRVSSVDGDDALMMAIIENRLKVMEAQELPKPKFMLGEQVRVTEDIRGRIERIEFRRGAVLPFYEISWWDNGSRVFEWFIETDLRVLETHTAEPGSVRHAPRFEPSRPTTPPPPKPKR